MARACGLRRRLLALLGAAAAVEVWFWPSDGWVSPLRWATGTDRKSSRRSALPHGIASERPTAPRPEGEGPPGESRRGRRGGARGGKRPAQILHPFKVKRGGKLASFHQVFKAWGREIGKEDFSISHAAKAVRLMPKCEFKNFEGEHPVLSSLVNATQGLLRRGEAPDEGDVVGMIRAVAELRESVPQLLGLLPQLAPLVPGIVGSLGLEDLSQLILAAGALREDSDELWQLVPASLSFLAAEADNVPVADIPGMVLALGQLPRDPEVDAALSALQRAVERQLDQLRLPALSKLLVGLSEVDGVSEGVKKAASLRVSEQAKYWKYEEIEPHLWRIAVVYASLGLADLGLLRTIARTALRETGLAALRAWGVAALSWSFEELKGAKDGLDDFRFKLKQEVALRGLTPEQVELSRLGPEGGGDPELAAFWRSGEPREGKRRVLLAPRARLPAARGQQADAYRSPGLPRGGDEARRAPRIAP